MKMEATDIDALNDKKSQTSTPPAAFGNQIVAAVRVLEASPLHFNWKPAFSAYGLISQKGEYSNIYNGKNCNHDYGQSVKGTVT